jgi:hypothetical protein
VPLDCQLAGLKSTSWWSGDCAGLCSGTKIVHVWIAGLAGLRGKIQGSRDRAVLCRLEGVTQQRSRMPTDCQLGRPPGSVQVQCRSHGSEGWDPRRAGPVHIAWV